jgi:hypothetical protein
MEFVSLKSIIYDLLNIIRGAKITDNEVISERQVESWIHEYRGKLLKQDIDKGKYINPDYVQEYIDINGNAYISLEIVDINNKNYHRTNIQIPKTLDLNFNTGITFIGDSQYEQIPLVPKNRIPFQEYRRFTKGNSLAYLDNRYIYIINPVGLNKITLRGIFEIPTELPGFTLNSKYPIPIDKVPTLKEMILRNELGIEYSAPSDNINDDAHKDLSSNVTGYNQTYRTNRAV